MAAVAQILWRQVTDADFLCVERSSENTPEGGGGQTYFSLSFGEHLDIEEFARFLGVEPPHSISQDRPAISHDVGVLSDQSVVERIEFMPRYKNRPDNRYRIARQNRQRSNQVRHPAWTLDRGFPIAPDDISRPDDPRMPDLSQLKLIVVREQDGSYFAGYINADQAPRNAPVVLAPLFAPNRDSPPDGLLDLSGEDLQVVDLAEIVRSANGRPFGGGLSSPEIEDARDATARAAGGRSRRGQGFRQSADERAAIDAHAMALATRYFEQDDWNVEDRSVNHPYDLFCSRAAEELHVEVKGTTADGGSVLLTPNEVEFARLAFPATALLIVHGVQLTLDGNGRPRALGGAVTLLRPWDIDVAGELKPTGYAYELM